MKKNRKKIICIFTLPIFTCLLLLFHFSFFDRQITVSSSNNQETVHIKDTASTVIDSSYFSKQHFSVKELDTIQKSKKVILEFSQPVTITEPIFASKTTKDSYATNTNYSNPDDNLVAPAEGCTLVLNDNNNVISYTFFAYNTGSVIINGSTTFNGCLAPGEAGHTTYNISNLTINADLYINATYSTYTFRNTIIDTLCIKKDPAKCIHFEDNTGLGSSLTINNLYLDYTSDNTTISSKNKLQLAQHSSDFRVGNVFYCNPACNYNSIDYNNIQPASNVINFYGYGGATAYNAKAKKVLAIDNYTNLGGTYINYVKDFTVNSNSLPKDANLTKGMTSYTYNFDSLAVTGTFLNTEDPASGNTYTKSLKQQTIQDTTKITDPQYQYAVYVPESVNPAESGDYTYTSNGKTYTMLKASTCTFPVGTTTYYVEVGGVFKEYSVTVNPCYIEEISATLTDGAENLLVGSELTKDQVEVSARYVGETKAEAIAKDAFTLESKKIQEGTNQITIRVDRGEGYSPLTTTVTVNGFTDTIKSYKAHCLDDRTEMKAFDTLQISDVELTDVTYNNPNRNPSASVKSGFAFLTNGIKETDSIQIQPGENKISITYNGVVQEDVITITGYVPVSFEANAAFSTMYTDTVLTVGNVSLSNVIYNDKNNTKEELVEKGFHFLVDGKEEDSVPIVSGTNTFAITYNGYTMENAITINGITNDVTKITAEYIGPTIYEDTEIDTDSFKVRVSVYHSSGEVTVVDTMLDLFVTYHITTDEDNYLEISYQGMTVEPVYIYRQKDTVKEITKVVYIGDTESEQYTASDFYIEAVYASGKMTNSNATPALHETLDIKPKEKTDTETTLSFTYTTDDETTGTSKVTAQALVSLNSNQQVTKVQNVDSTTIATATPTATIVPTTSTNPNLDQTPVPQVSSTPEMTESPIKETVKPTQAVATPTATIQPTATAQLTTAPTASPALTPAPTSTVSTVRTTFTLNRITYKITSTTAKTVSIVGCETGVTSADFNNTIKINEANYKITAIGANAFAYCTSLSGNLQLPNSVKSIGKKAFYHCPKISTVTLSSSLKTIGVSAFEKCKKLKIVDFNHNKVAKIGKRAFYSNKPGRAFRMSNRHKSYYKKILQKKKNYN